MAAAAEEMSSAVQNVAAATEEQTATMEEVSATTQNLAGLRGNWKRSPGGLSWRKLPYTADIDTFKAAIKDTREKFHLHRVSLWAAGE